MIEYEDFSIKIEPRRGDTFPVIVLRSPAGEGRSQFRLPLDPSELGDILVNLGETVRSATVTQAEESVEPGMSPPDVGHELFEELFSGPVRSLLDRSMGMIHGQQKGLRIKIHIDPEDPSLAPLASLPWELIYRRDTRDFLNLSRFTPVLRYLDVQRPYTPLPLDPPLRILVVLSEPKGYVGLDLDRERQLIQDTWAQLEGVQVEFMEHATMFRLQDRLAEQTYHVLHYMGHGAFDERTGQGVLVLEDERGNGVLVDGTTLGILLRDVPSMRLVFLNACETARVTKRQGLDPFAGVASAMVMAGIPAVVAMQFPISDKAAIRFSQRFYPLLARGNPVDMAVAEGRRAIRLAEPDTLEWCTPVLFMRAPDGSLFEVAEEKARTVPIPDEEIEAPDENLEPLYAQGMRAFWLEDWDTAIDFFQQVQRRRSDYREVTTRLTEAQRQKQLRILNTEAQAAEHRGDWTAAIAALERLSAEAPDYQNATDRLEQARSEQELAGLYRQAGQMAQEQHWQAVVNIFDSIHAKRADYPDPQGLLAEARGHLAATDNQAMMAALYAKAVAEAEAGNLVEARDLFRQLQGADPNYRDVTTRLAQIEIQLEPAPAQDRRPVWLLAIAGLIVAVAVIAALLFFTRDGDGTVDQPDTPVPGVVLLEETDTPTSVPTEATPAVEEPTQQAEEPTQPAEEPTQPAEEPTQPPEEPTQPPEEPTQPPEEPTPIPTPLPAIVASQGVNIRSGPNTGFETLGQTGAGVRYPIAGRNEDGTWWQIALEDGSLGWVAAQVVDTEGDVDQIALAEEIPELPVVAANLRGKLVFTRNTQGGQRGANDIYLYDLATQSTTRLTVNGDDDWLPSWSADGTRISFSSNRENENRNDFDIWSMNADGTNQQRYVATSAWDEYSSWSPRNNGQIAFVTTADGNSEIHVASNSNNVRRVTFNGARDEWPSWSPDAQRIVHSSDEAGNRDIYVTQVGSGSSQRLYGTPGDENKPVWSPDGRWIALVQRANERDPYGQIVLISSQGDAPEAITETYASDPAWSPDGRWIVFVRGVDSNGNGYLDERDESDLWAVQVAAGSATGEPIPVVQADGSDYAPSWAY